MPNVGLEFITLRSRVTCTTEWTSQVPPTCFCLITQQSCLQDITVSLLTCYFICILNCTYPMCACYPARLKVTSSQKTALYLSLGFSSVATGAPPGDCWPVTEGSPPYLTPSSRGTTSCTSHPHPSLLYPLFKLLMYTKQCSFPYLLFYNDTTASALSPVGKLPSWTQPCQPSYTGCQEDRL